MGQSALERAETFMYMNARLLDRHLFAHVFKDGPKEPVLTTLRAYQNVDGGFGHALEPDIRAPISQPQPVEIAFHVLDMVGDFDDPMVGRACDYLVSISGENGGVPFSLPSLNEYPHAPWWTAPENPPENTNPTAAIAGLMLKNGVNHTWLDRAIPFCWREIETTESGEFHDVIPLLLFLEHAPERDRAQRELERIAQRVRAAGTVATDFNGEGYIHPPLDWAATPQGFMRSQFSDELVAANLEALKAAQQDDGGWTIGWPPISPACELEWRGWTTIGALRKLRAYGE